MSVELENEKGQIGMSKGQEARERLKLKEKQKEQELNFHIDHIVNDAAKKSALSAIQLNQLLRKKWSEERNAYKLISGIKTERQKRRYDAIMRGEF